MNAQLIYIVITGGEASAFGSLRAIYTRHTAAALGVSLSALYALRVADGVVFKNDRCTIQRVPVIRCRQSK